MIERRTVLAGLVGALGLSSSLRVFAAGATLPPYGWAADLDCGTVASLYVAPDGDDEAEGTPARPLRTLQRGVDMLANRTGGSLAIRGGIYRETVSLDALRGRPEAGYRLQRYGRERVTISAAEVLTGWRPCTAAETAALGLPPGVQVARFDRARLEHGAVTALNLHEVGEWCSIATDRADVTNLGAVSDDNTFHNAEFLLDAEDRILGIRDARLKGMPTAWMAQVQILIYHFPNVVSVDLGAGFDVDTGTLTLADPTRRLERSGEAAQMRYALQNIGPALREGQWIARDEGAMVAVYFWPRNSASLAGGVEVSLRPACIDFGAAAHVELAGIEAVRASGEDRLSGICIRRLGGNDLDGGGEGLTLTHCRAGENHSTGGRGYGAIYLRGARGVILRNCSIGPSRNAYGLFLSDCQDADLRLLHITGVSKSPARFYGLRRAVLAFSLFEESAHDAHANKFNFYEGCDAVLVYGVRTRGVGGYATFQEASRIHFAFCELDCAPESHNRALVSQNRRAGAGQGGADGSGDPLAGTTFYYWNNSLLADRRHPEPANALSLGPGGNSQRHVLHNNILHGGGFADIYLEGADPDKETRSHNIYTGFAYWQGTRTGWRLARGETVIRVGGRGRDMRPIIGAELAPLFPGFTDWGVDIDGTPVDWDHPPIGCRVDL